MTIPMLWPRGVAPTLLALSLALAPISPARATDKAASPFARVYLALRGCTSCSHCRTAIRQMVRSGSGGGEARLSGDGIEVIYPKPRQVPLRDVIRRLAENRLHDLSLVDVLFEARGSFASGPLGATVFTLRETGQSFPVTVEPSLHRLKNGAPVRLVAVVEGWRGKGEIRLVAREVREDA